MIHPINIPDDLLAINPKRPQLIEPRRKAKISYSTSGRKFRGDEPPEPKAPLTLWNDFFLRTFIHRVNCSAPTDDEGDGESLNSLIDIVDLQQEQPHQQSQFCRESKVKLAPAPSLKTDRAVIDDETGGTAAFKGEFDCLESEVEALTRFGVFGSGARLGVPQLERGKSVKVKKEAFESILDSCCPIPVEAGKPIFKEFARFDFSHSNFFDDFASPGTDAERPGLLKKHSMTLIPNTVGSRLWTSVHGSKIGEQRPKELLFNVREVHFGRDGSIDLSLAVHNYLGRTVSFEIEQHLHEVHGEKVGDAVGRSRRTLILSAVDNSPLQIHIEITEEIKRIFVDPSKFLVVTLHGRIL